MTLLPRPQRLPRGVTVVDAMIVLAVTSVLLGQALPAMRQWRQSQVLQAVVHTVDTDVRFARSQALAGERGVRLAVQALPEGGSCTLVHTGAIDACTCTGGQQARCEAGAQVLRLTEQPARSGAVVSTVGRSLLFDGGKGTVTPTATLVVSDAQGHSVRHIVNIMGRVRHCSPNHLAGYPSCT